MLTIDAIHLREINMPLAHPVRDQLRPDHHAPHPAGRDSKSDGLTAWGECVAGEHPYFSDEMIDTAWIITET